MQLNTALLFRDCLDQTIAEGLHTMRGGEQDGLRRTYAAFLEAARPLLLEAKDADFGSQHHVFIYESLREAGKVMPKGASQPGAWQAQTFLTGFSEGVCAVAGRLEKGPLAQAGQAAYALTDLARRQGRIVRQAISQDEPARRRAFLTFGLEMGDGADATDQTMREVEQEAGRSDHPLHAVCEVLHKGLEHVFEEENGAPPAGVGAARWLQLCEEAHLRMRSFVSGATRALQVTQPELARGRAWALPIQDGRLPRSAMGKEANWWVREALGILAALRSRLYWGMPGAADTRAAEGFVLQFARQLLPAPQLAARLGTHVAKDPVEQRMKAWVMGTALGTRRARVLPPGGVERAWVRSLKGALPSLDVDGLLEGVDPSGEPEGSCGHGKAHHICQELVVRFCRAQGADPVLPERPEDAHVLGFVRAHHVASLPHAHAHEHEEDVAEAAEAPRRARAPSGGPGAP